MDTISVLTLHLAQALGLYMVVAGIGGLAAPERWQKMMDELVASPALQLLTGVLVFAIGVTLAIVHTHFTDPLATVVTLIGWVALAEGALLIAVPRPVLRIGLAAIPYTRVWAIVSLILGILIGLAGLTGRATVI
ncbi:hypothetical protein GCM10023219_22930 [Stakelama sediminis]|uniref:Uncharacterized protein YjeT (DUF2065 family) n=1 Tax=Stakelama sediminis TaxID=463200 RepID=A0A840YZW3_9SPHN|nr:DUF2065 domain-containing protein [Stakelama sediminis]MBB5719248.1 uncharacterized protein YjeT (DUF2065 family) [Stakelama sediminis]